MLIALAGLVWSGQRYRRMAASDPPITSTPSKVELYSLAGLTLFAAVCVAITAAITSWEKNLELPLREFTFIGIAMLVATLYAGYRKLTATIDHTDGQPPDRRLSLSGESVGLGVLALCGLVAVLTSGPRTGPVASGTQTGDADAIGPRLVGEPVAFAIPGATQVMSGITAHGDRIYFGTDTTRISSRIGTLVCLDRSTGEVKWKFEGDDDLLPVFCTPTVSDGRVYCGEGLHTDKDCRLFCVDAATGKPAWDKPFQTKSHTEGAPAVANGKLFFPAGDDGLFAVDAKTGAKLWQFPGGKDKGIHIDAAPAVSGNRVFVGSGLYSFVAVCLDAKSGEEKWRTDLKLRAFGAPIVIGKQVYYGVGTGNMVCGHLRLRRRGRPKERTPAGAVVCLDIDSGKERGVTTCRVRSTPGSRATPSASTPPVAMASSIASIARAASCAGRRASAGPSQRAPAVATSGGLPVSRSTPCRRMGTWSA